MKNLAFLVVLSLTSCNTTQTQNFVDNTCAPEFNHPDIIGGNLCGWVELIVYRQEIDNLIKYGY